MTDGGKRRSAVVSIALVFTLAYAVSDLGHFLVQSAFSFEDWSRQREGELIGELRLSNYLLGQGERGAALARLSDAKSLGLIDFYSLRQGGATLAGDTLPERGMDELPAGRVVREPRVTVAAARQGDEILAIGFNRVPALYLWDRFKDYRNELFLDMALVALMTIGIVFHNLRDLLRVIGLFGRRRREGLGTLDSKSSEAQAVVHGLRAYEREMSGLRREGGRLRRQVCPAVRAELDSGREPPYQFGCVMARADINDYSTICATHPVEPFMQAIDRFFTEASDAIARYGGYVCDFVGDEIVFYFKESEARDAAALAAAAVRDLGSIAASINLETRERHGYPFLVKSALASGTLRFGPQAGGYALSGGVFVETVRILAQADERSRNSVLLPERLVERIGSVADCELKKEVELRGVPGKSRLCEVSRFKTLDEALAEGATGPVDLYRADTQLLRLLEALRADGAGSGCERELLAALQGLCAPSASPAVRDAYLSCLRSNPSSALVSLSRKLVDPSLYPGELHERLTQALESADARTVANAIDSLVHFEPERRSEAIRKLTAHASNRVMGNALLQEGIARLSPEVIRGLRQMLRAPESVFQASGAYAIGEIARFYRAADLPYFETHRELQSLIGELGPLTLHPDASVRTQAERALGKAGRADSTGSRKAG